MELGKIFVMTLIFVFAAFLFPTVNNACQNMNETLTTAPVIKVFPYLFLIAVIAVPLYYIMKERK